MPSYLRYIGALLVFAALFVPSLPISSTAAAAPARSPYAGRLVELVNARRAQAGLRPLRINVILMTEAQRFSRVQADMGRLSHRGIDNTTAGRRLARVGYRWRFYGENLAAGQEGPEEVVSAWLNSPSHRAVLLTPKAREIGIGHTFKRNDPARYYDYWVMEVGRR